MIGADEPKGWSNQVGKKFIAQITYVEGHRVLRNITDNGMGWDLTLDYGLSLGNFKTSAAVGGTLRWGRNLPKSFNAYYTGSGSESALLGLPFTHK